ncbi:MAG: helix-turn-helix transcriptional regulator [Silicimonas sp.]|nr:helix-turn-helix transcriptional regulator [Silicimonas sp.]
MSGSGLLLWCAVALQLVSAGFFLADILITLLGLPVEPFSWMFVELVQIGAALALILGVVMGGLVLREHRQRTARAEAALHRARSAFRDVLEDRFAAWKLTPAERDVALFAIKGFSIADIAGFREVSEGTIKAQTAAIYRKAGVSGRSQLLSLFVDDLIEGDGVPRE